MNAYSEFAGNEKIVESESLGGNRLDHPFVRIPGATSQRFQFIRGMKAPVYRLKENGSGK